MKRLAGTANGNISDRALWRVLLSPQAVARFAPLADRGDGKKSDFWFYHWATARYVFQVTTPAGPVKQYDFPQTRSARRATAFLTGDREIGLAG